MSDLVHNERLKAKAAFFNNLDLVLLALGLVLAAQAQGMQSWSAAIVSVGLCYASYKQAEAVLRDLRG